MRIQSELRIVAAPSLEQAVAKDFKVEEKDIKELLNENAVGCSGEMPTEDTAREN